MNWGKIIITGILSVAVLSLSAQNYITPVNSDLTPPTPQSAAPVERQMPMPSTLTGTVNLSIPIHTVTVGDFSFPVYLQYQTSGIKVMDDPCPVGYGWALMPALRATRTVMGRPDEYFDFLSTISSAMDPTVAAYQCMVNVGAISLEYPERYDSQHDIFTFALPSGNITRVLDMSSGEPVFIGGLDEYKVSSDSTLNIITVNDGKGVKYIFGGPHERQHNSQSSVDARTAWALQSIETSTGQIISFNWDIQRHPHAQSGFLGGMSFMDAWRSDQWGGGVTLDDFVSNNYEDGLLVPFDDTIDFLRIKSITYPGGSINFSYFGNNYGPFLSTVSISNGSEIIKTANLQYTSANGEACLLQQVTLSDEGVYSMNYNTDHHWVYDSRYAQDWWGYYNAKNNNLSLTPKVRVLSFTTFSYQYTFYSQELGDADRSVDTVAMQANILTKITYPTGGYNAFEYEPHRFAPTRLELKLPGPELDTTRIVHPNYDPYLSVGGGLRVKQIVTTTGSNDQSPQIVRFEYPLATVRAVPSMGTFIEVCKTATPIPEEYCTGVNRIGYMRRVSINPVSNYMRYDMGTIPIWYDHVTAIYDEGKVVWHYKDFVLPNTIIDVSLEDNIYRTHQDLTKLFSNGPQLVAQETYRSIGSNSFELVQSDRMKYKIATGTTRATSHQIDRLLLYINSTADWKSSPDFDDARNIYASHLQYLPTPVESYIDIYSTTQYSIIPMVERLDSVIKTTYISPNDSIRQVQTFTYKSGTSLVASSTTTNSDGSVTTTSIDYPVAGRTAIETQMVNANAVALPVKETITKGSASTVFDVDYAKVGLRSFKPTRMTTVYGNSTDTVFSPTFDYDLYGNLRCATDKDNCSVTWLWGYNGQYPVYKIDGMSYSALLSTEGTKVNSVNVQHITLSTTNPVTKYNYKPSVGVTLATQPWGTRTQYVYDSANRLSSTEIIGLGTVQSIFYQIGQDVVNMITVTDRPGASAARFRSASTTYDGLGRVIKTIDNKSGISTLSEYDSMGRLARQSMPSVLSPGTYDWQLNGYEASPRNLAVSQTKAGEAWYNGQKDVTMRMLTNTASGELACPRYSVGANGGITHHGNYQAGTLIVQETTNEDGHTVRTFTDMSKNVVMTVEGKTGDWLATRSVYDDYGRLRYVLPPNIEDGSYEASASELLAKAYIYTYDYAGRVASSKTPGCTASQTRYSRGGRVIAERTPSMASGKWLVHFYDFFGREAFTSIASLTDTQVNALCNVHRRVVYNTNNPNANISGYGIVPPIPITMDLLKATYYDNYAFAQNDSTLSFVSNCQPGTAGTLQPITTPTGLPTGYADFEADSTGLKSVIYYDTYGRVLQQVKEHINGHQRVGYAYNNLGEVIAERDVFTHSTGTAFDRTTSNTYDTSGRIASVSITENGKTARMSYEYGDNGKVSKETLGNNVSRIFSYDVHGWLTETVTKVPVRVLDYGASLSNMYYDNLSTALPSSSEVGTNAAVKPPITITTDYTDRLFYADGAVPRYSGCPSARMMTLGGRYDYTFDNHNRLIRADYTPGTNADSEEDFSTEYTYNEVGAPLTLKRYGVVNRTEADGEMFGILDNLTYTYNANRLSRIDYTGEGENFYGRTGYNPNPSEGTAYYYWHPSGQLKRDSSREISNTMENHLGLLTRVDISVRSHLGYIYDADGNLVRSEAYSSASGQPALMRSRSYAGNRVFSGDTIIYSRFAGGYFDHDGAVHYNIIDYQGSVTMVIDSLRVVKQHNGYYPYGEPWREPGGQPFLFSDKERNRLFNLNDYDFHARRLTPATALWNAPDPLAGKYPNINPYTYCASNPVMYVDPSGMDIAVLYSEDIVGHLALLVQDEDDMWHYFSLNGTKVNDITNGEAGLSINADGSKTFASVQEFLNHDFNNEGSSEDVENGLVAGFRYNKAYQIETTPEQDAKAMRSIHESIEDDNYNLLLNNCSQTVVSTTESIGIRSNTTDSFENMAPLRSVMLSNELLWSNGIQSILPSTTFNNFVKYNPGGKLYETN